MDIHAIQARPSGDYEVTVTGSAGPVSVLVTADGAGPGAAGVDAAPLRDAVRALHRARVLAGGA